MASWTCRIQYKWERHISTLCVRCTPKHAHTHTYTHNEDYVSLRGHFSVAGEQLMWQCIQQMERDGGRKWEGERGRREERERKRQRERVWGGGGHLAINSSSCPSGSAEPSACVSSWVHQGLAEYNPHSLLPFCSKFLLSSPASRASFRLIVDSTRVISSSSYSFDTFIPRN